MTTDIYFIPLGERTKIPLIKLRQAICDNFLGTIKRTSFGYSEDKLRNTLKKAKNTFVSVIMGDNELAKNQVLIKIMWNGEQKLVDTDKFIEEFKKFTNNIFTYSHSNCRYCNADL